MMIAKFPGNYCIAPPQYVYFLEDNNRRHRALSIRGAETCRKDKQKYRSGSSVRFVFPAAREGLRSFSLGEDPESQPEGFGAFRWEHVTLNHCRAKQ